MASKKIENLGKGDEIVLWCGPAVGEIYATVKWTYNNPDSHSIGIVTEEIDWAVLVAPIGTDVELAS